MSAQVAADLRAAAGVLRRDGWTQGVYHAPNGCHCAEGAIALVVGQHVASDDPPGDNVFHLDRNWWVVGDDPEAGRRRDAAEDAVRALVDTEELGVVHWNDAPGRTADEVIAALEAAADAAETDQ